MKTLKLATLLLAGALVFGSSSWKYEDGPALSLRTKKARVAGEWEIDKIINADGTEESTSTSGVESTYTFEKDGTGTSTITGSFLGQTVSEKSTFKWEFTDSKKKIKITDEDGEANEGTIMRLTNDEMWIKDTDNEQVNFKAK